ncbi:MAG: site-specific DNA-methyltransferase [Chitinophagaceae bacterium]|nr:site-specific DNA-methyltransferase [Chitinophagaceae bacterium]
MPTLHWIGKDKVINHHLDVPFKVLEHQYRYAATESEKETPHSGNKIIHGDNLEALKALIPEYEGKIKCIYIDPPYNTGNENWVYNDNVNDPKIKKWLDSVVGKEGEDLTRHDKWLCMMYPRLKLLHKLLADDGALFISIDDNEQANLKLICQEIFGANNHLGTFCWKRRSSSALADKYLSSDHEYVVCFQKGNFQSFKGLEKTYENYKNPNNDPKGAWMLDNLTVGMNKNMRPNQFYDLVDPKTGNIFPANPNRVWAYIPESMNKMIQQERIFFPSDISKKPMLKRYQSDLKNTHNPISTFIPTKSESKKQSFGIGLNSEATKELQNIFNEKNFDYSKPRELIEFFVDQVCNSNDIVLDSFAGSGTTAHAVLNLNKKDGGNRKFILIELKEYAEAITAGRIERVIKGYTGTEGTGGSFDYYELGESLFNEDGNLNENIGIEKIKEYIFYTETNQALASNANIDHPDFLSLYQNTAYYFFYRPHEITTLDHVFLAGIKTKAELYIIYADNCLLTKTFLNKHNIIFKKIPRDITRF